MRIEYVVHSCVVHPISAQVTIDGHLVTALIPGLTVELIHEGSRAQHGHTFRFVPVGDEDMRAHQDMFAVGNTVAADFSLMNRSAPPVPEPQPEAPPETSSDHT